MDKQKHSLIEYKREITAIITRAKELNLSDTETEKVFEECFDELNKKCPTNKSKIIIKQRSSCSSFFSFAAKVTLFVLFLFLIPYILLNVHQPTSSVVLRNVQGLIYPGLKILRFFAVPIVKTYPSLTNLYDEACLVLNPFFYVSDMICWPCEEVHSVVDLTGFNNHSLYQSGIPFVVQTNQRVNFEQLKHVYQLHKDIFLRDASDIKSNNSTLQSMDDIFHKHWDEQGTTHVSWRVNRMYPSQILRKLFPRPYFISERLGQTVERFILIDEPATEGYSFPDPECCYAFAIQGSGERTIILKPSKECGSVCRTVSVVLKPSFILWYNWWYWKPISLPKDNATEISITYISSYC